jgi:hypothetical protein
VEDIKALGTEDMNIIEGRKLKKSFEDIWN